MFVELLHPACTHLLQTAMFSSMTTQCGGGGIGKCHPGGSGGWGNEAATILHRPRKKVKPCLPLPRNTPNHAHASNSAALAPPTTIISSIGSSTPSPNIPTTVTRSYNMP